MIELGTSTSGGAVRIDPARLVASRLLLCANSGGGKSWALRKLAEGLARVMPTIIIDPEGEFASLRERFDMVLAGEGGEVGIEIKSAALLGRRLIEMSLSAVIDISELEFKAKQEYVEAFIRGVMAIPKRSWRPAAFIIDEAQLFAPEKGTSSSSSTEAVNDLATRGRKRGFGLIVSTPRLALLSKSTAGLCMNNLIGQSSLKNDQASAGFSMGVSTREAADQLRPLKPGQFYALGPAMVGIEGVELVRIGAVETKHPEPGQLAIAGPPQASARIQAVIPELADLAATAEAEENELEALRERVKELNEALKAAREDGQTMSQADFEALVEKYRAEGKSLERERMDRALSEAIEIHFADMKEALDKIGAAGSTLMNRVEFIVGGPITATLTPPQDARLISRQQIVADPFVSSELRAIEERRAKPAISNGKASLDRLILAALRDSGGAARDRISLGVLTCKAHKGGHFGNVLGALRSRESIVGKDAITITPIGMTELGDAPRLPAGRELLEQWKTEVGGIGSEIMAALAVAHPKALTREELGKATGKESMGGHFGNTLGKLRSLAVIMGMKEMKLNPIFFERKGR